MDTVDSRRYDPREFKALTFHDATARFRDGADTPRAYLERCLETDRGARAGGEGFRGAQRRGRARRGRCQHCALESRQAAVGDRRHAGRDQGSSRNEGHAHRFRLRGLQGEHDPARQRRRVGAAPGRAPSCSARPRRRSSAARIRPRPRTRSIPRARRAARPPARRRRSARAWCRRRSARRSAARSSALPPSARTSR